MPTYAIDVNFNGIGAFGGFGEFDEIRSIPIIRYPNEWQRPKKFNILLNFFGHDESKQHAKDIEFCRLLIRHRFYFYYDLITY